MTLSKIVAAALCVGLTLAPRARGEGVAATPVAIRGYDVVAYFAEGRAVKGSPAFSREWDGSRYQFSSAEHEDMFARDPDHYLPQFAGLCAVAVGLGKKLEADPTVWKIIDGKLYVFSSATARSMAERDPSVLSRSREAWREQR
jgi:YHS domain-containing protein